jgi:diacylglycerol kinase family enzyme
MGTGNGWARAYDVPRFDAMLRIMAPAARVGLLPPTITSHLIEVEGTLTHFAGTGWDADLIADFHAQKTERGIVPPRFRNGLVGYLRGLFTRTVPRHLAKHRAEVEIVNLGAPALTVNEEGQAIACDARNAGEVLYRGPTSVCAVGTTEEWGFGFRAFPFARLVAGRMNIRNYGATAAEAVMRIPSLWRGAHPTPKMDSWFVTRCAMRYSEPLPFQLGGDLLGYRDAVEYRLASETVRLVDFPSWLRGEGTLEATMKRLPERDTPALSSNA